MVKINKIEEFAAKFSKDLQESGLDGMIFAADKTDGAFCIKVDNGLDAVTIIAKCIECVAEVYKLSPWHAMDAIGFMLGEYQPPEDITQPLKEFADMARELYEYEHRSH